MGPGGRASRCRSSTSLWPWIQRAGRTSDITKAGVSIREKLRGKKFFFKIPK